MKRFFVDQPLTDTATGTPRILNPQESHHLQHVLRLGTGDEVEVFDGRGHSATAHVIRLAKRQVEIELSGPVRSQPQPNPLITLATAVPKVDRFRWLIEKAVEVGVTQILPLLTERSVVNPRDHKLEKLREAMVQAAKQCRRDWIPELAPAATWPSLLDSPRSGPMVVADRSGQGVADWARSLNSPPESVTVVIGPEGGFTADELRQADEAGAQRVTLSDAILRTETAAIVAVALLRNSWR